MMALNIPWWGKIGAKLVLSRLPFGYAVWQRLGLFRHGDMDSSEYATRVFHSHIERSGLNNQLSGKIILELGPGDSISSAIIASAYGARAIIVDAGRFVRNDVAPYIDLERSLAEKGLLHTDLTGCHDIEEILSRCGARYLTDGLESLKKIEDESVDLIFSQAVLEHVRRHDFLETMQECRRILRPGGICSHQVDLRDHLSGGLSNLRFSENIWESTFFAKSGFYTNRIQYSQMLNIFRQAGFQTQVTEVRRWEALPIRRNHLSKEFSSLPENELSISGFDVLLR